MLLKGNRFVTASPHHTHTTQLCCIHVDEHAACLQLCHMIDSFLHFERYVCERHFLNEYVHLCMCTMYVHACMLMLFICLSLPLSFDNNNISDIGAEALSEALRNCPRLQYLSWVSHIPYGFVCVTWSALCCILSYTCTYVCESSCSCTCIWVYACLWKKNDF